MSADERATALEADEAVRRARAQPTSGALARASL